MGEKVIISNFSELVRNRYSCRSFSNTSISGETELVINKYNSSIIPPFYDQIRIAYITRDRLKEENFFTTGTYGMIKGAKGYLIGITKPQSPQTFENFGYCMEDALLHLTSLGIDTCWIGGVFDRKTFGKMLSIEADEIVPAVIALGYASERRTLRDKIVRWSARGNRRKPMDQLFFESDLRTPLDFEGNPLLRDILENVRLAPSASNKQPWRVVKVDSNLHFYLDRDKLYSKLIPNVDLQRIDLGIALYHFEMAAIEAKIPITRQMSPAPPQVLPQFEYIISYTI